MEEAAPYLLLGWFKLDAQRCFHYQTSLFARRTEKPGQRPELEVRTIYPREQR
jgi:hypothetical protein